MNIRVALWLLPLIFTFAGQIGSAQSQPTFTHKDWTVSCDNTGVCRAAGYNCVDCTGSGNHEYAEGEQVSVLLSRAMGPETQIHGTVKIADLFKDERPSPFGNLPEMKVVMSIDGQDIATVLLQDYEGHLPDLATRALVKALPKDSQIVFRNGPFERHLSDKGAAAVLVFIDQFQGRLNTTDAAIRTGPDDPNQSQPTPVPLIKPVNFAPPKPGDTALFENLRMPVSQALYAATNTNDCPSFHGESKQMPDQTLLSLRRLTPRKLMADVICWRGAYNAGRGVFVINAKAPFDPVLVTFGATDIQENGITQVHRGRGIGDCYSGRSFVWTGATFVLSREWNTGLCRGFAGGAWDLPTFVSEVKQ